MSTRAAVRPRAGRRRLFTREDQELTFISLGTTLWYVAFCYVPFFGIVFAFKNYKYRPGKGFLYSLFVTSKWVGLDNIRFLFRSPNLLNIFRNTLGYNLIFLLIGVTLPVALAILISQLYSKKLAKTCQTAMFLPHFLSWVVVGYFVFSFLSTDKGLLNGLLKAWGQAPEYWYQEPKHWPFLLVLIHTWKAVGYSMVVYMASIAGMDASLYESAVIDGATKWQQIKFITLPLLRPVVSILFILNLGHIFNTDFGLFYQVPRDSNSLISVTQTLDVYVYKALMQNSNYNYSSATALLQSVLGCVTLLSANVVVKKIDPNSGLF